jgi:hypothetical protein
MKAIDATPAAATTTLSRWEMSWVQGKGGAIETGAENPE